VESTGFQDLLSKLSVNCFEDIIALVALYRPGVMASGMTDEFIERKKDPSKITYPDPMLEDILKDTYGIILYQEQVMQVARKFANFTPAQADDMRKAMSKKIPETLDKMKEGFISGAAENGIAKKKAEDLFDTLSKFGAYGFNKSHSAAYGKITYQTAFLKANYPTEYMSALLTCEMHNTDKVAEYVDECIRMGIKVEKPSVVKSYNDFTIEGEGIIRFGLKAIKNVGEAAIESIVKSREKEGFKTFYDFCTKVDMQKVNKRVIENLVKAGAFDNLNLGRRPLFQVIDNAMSQASSRQKDIMAGQTSFFDVFDGDEVPEVEIKDKHEWHENEMLVSEKEALGFYFSGHPLARHADDIIQLASGEIATIKEKAPAGQELVIGGMIKHRKQIKTKRGGIMAAFILEDLSDSMEGVIFPSSYTPEIAQELKEDAMVVAVGKVDDSRGRRQFIADTVLPLETAKSSLVGKLVIRIKSIGINKDHINTIKSTTEKYPGNIPVEIEIKTKKFDIIKISTDSKVRINDSLLEELSKTTGRDSVFCVGRANKIQ
jgi:DNA polymerase-3 subunit alpha